MRKRTKIQFEKHELTVEQYPGIQIHTLALPGSSTNKLVYINAKGVMTVTGDFGNWVFCREFIPSPEGDVSDGYWVEKLKIASCQHPFSYDGEKTKNALEHLLYNEKDLTHYEKDYLEMLIGIAEDELEYTYHIYRDKLPERFSYGDLPHKLKDDFWLNVVFDGFEEICYRLAKSPSIDPIQHENCK